MLLLSEAVLVLLLLFRVDKEKVRVDETRLAYLIHVNGTVSLFD